MTKFFFVRVIAKGLKDRSVDATPLSPDARRDTTNVRPKLRAMPSVRSFIISQIWNLQRLVSPRQPRLYLVFPPL
jgi:hypothetical protein